MERRTILILKQKNRGKDTLPLKETAMEVLLVKNKVRSINSDYVLLNTVRKEIDARNLLRAYYAARKKARLTDVRFHDLRHTFATRLVQAGVDLYIFSW